jgi:hypothetical protein
MHPVLCPTTDYVLLVCRRAGSDLTLDAGGTRLLLYSQPGRYLHRPVVDSHA